MPAALGEGLLRLRRTRVRIPPPPRVLTRDREGRWRCTLPLIPALRISAGSDRVRRPPGIGEGSPGLWCEPTSQNHLPPRPPSRDPPSPRGLKDIGVLAYGHQNVLEVLETTRRMTMSRRTNHHISSLVPRTTTFPVPVRLGADASTGSTGDQGFGAQIPNNAPRNRAATAASPLISTLAASWRPAPNIVSSPGWPARITHSPAPRSLSVRPGEVITIVAGTFFAITPGPTRAQRASASSGEIGRGSQPPSARRTSSTWMKNSTVFIGASKGRRSNGGPCRTLSTSFSQGVRSRTARRTLSV